MLLRFYGVGNDKVFCQIIGSSNKIQYKLDYSQRNDNEKGYLVARVITLGSSKGCLVRAIYDGTWSFAVGMLTEGKAIPAWQLRIGHEHEHSMALEIETFDDMVDIAWMKWSWKDGWVPFEGSGIYAVTKPTFIGKIPVRDERCVVRSPVEIGLTTQHFIGGELLDVNDHSRIIPASQNLAIGDEVLCPGLFGYNRATITGPRSAETKELYFELERDRDDRHAWTSAGMIAKASIEKLSVQGEH